ncbi:MAG: ABC transporter ATP-binding protein [Acidimicrobiales bacterium]
MSPDPAWAVEIQRLSKTFGGTVAVDGIDLAVPRGTFYGLLGPNGAGKSTTLAMATGLLRPDAGMVRVSGIDVWMDPVAIKARIGVVPESLLLFERLSGLELLDYVGRLRGLPADVVAERSADLLKVLGLAADGHKLVVDYSQGMRKKVSLAAALLHTPEVLFLDEPFEAVDPVSVRTIRSVLDRFVSSGATIVFSSHVMATVEALCDHVAIMHEGSVVRTGSTADVMGDGSLDDAFADAVGAGVDDLVDLDWLRAT